MPTKNEISLHSRQRPRRKNCAAGSNAKKFRVGDRVWGDWQPGTFSEFAVVDESCAELDSGKGQHEEIVAISLVGITAHLDFDKAKLNAGEILFVNWRNRRHRLQRRSNGKNSRRENHHDGRFGRKSCRRKKSGADLVINYGTQNVADEVKKFAGRRERLVGIVAASRISTKRFRARGHKLAG